VSECEECGLSESDKSSCKNNILLLKFQLNAAPPSAPKSAAAAAVAAIAARHIPGTMPASTDKKEGSKWDSMPQKASEVKMSETDSW
jgi:hypothetical protein